MQDHEVVMKFGLAFTSEDQGRAMLQLERWLHEQGIPAVVIKETMPDDSKLRSRMTPLERANL